MAERFGDMKAIVQDLVVKVLSTVCWLRSRLVLFRSHQNTSVLLDMHRPSPSIARRMDCPDSYQAGTDSFERTLRDAVTAAHGAESISLANFRR